MSAAVAEPQDNGYRRPSTDAAASRSDIHHMRKCDDTVSTSCGERQRYTEGDRFRPLRWQSHSTTALDGRRRTRPRAEAIATTCFDFGSRSRRSGPRVAVTTS
jgi:hypothetical protein